MVSLATAVIPVSPKHRLSGVYNEAIASVHAQTVPTEVITVFDDEGRGAAWARNTGTAQVKTPFVIWLDADDLLRHTFVEECVKSYRRGAYVYTDWVIDGIIINTPECLNPHEIGQEHVITTFLAKAAWEAAGGFDESLTFLEDEDFYRRLHAYGWCGVRCSEPLIEYRRRLGHSLVNKDVIDSELQKQRVAEMAALFKQRYRRFEGMSDCGCISRQQKTETKNARQANDVLVKALYTPQKVQGAFTGRLYPRTGLGNPLWVHEDDARLRPDLFEIISENPENVSPDVETVKRLAEEAIASTESAVAEDATVFANWTGGGELVAPEQDAENVDTPDFESMTRADLLKYAKAHEIKVTGTGSRGRVTVEDLRAALA